MFAVISSLCLLAAAPSPPADVAVVCPPVLREALAPWIEYRREQGHRIVEVPPCPSADELRSRLRAALADSRSPAIVLVGDADPAARHDPAVAARCVPTGFIRAQVNVVFGSEPEIATDNVFADFDDDGLPEAAVGRLSVASPEELSRLVRRIIEYERSTDWGAWRRQVNFIAGIGGFGPIADAALENAAKTILTRDLPPHFASTMTYAAPASPYNPGPPFFREAAVARFNEGCLLWVYIGHGARTEVDRIPTPVGWYPILGARDVVQLAPRSQPPLACFLSCYSAAFDGEQPCLAEAMLRSAGGPIAVLGGSRVTMPYAMSILGQELMLGFFHERQTTFGEVFRVAKRNSVAKPRDDEASRQFDALATMLMPMAADLPAQRREHLALFNLLGDPLLRLRHAESVALTIPGEATAGGTLAVQATSPLAGRARIELVVRRDRLTFFPPPRDGDEETPDVVQERIATYVRANDPQLAVVEQTVPAGPVQFQLAVPAKAAGDCHVRIFIEGADGFAQGSADVRIRPTASP